MRQARAVCLDFDDTLWAMAPVLRHAEERFHDWLMQRYPRAATLATVEVLRERRRVLGEELPHLAHDLARLRHELYRRLAEESGCGPEMAGEALAEFQRLRNEVTLYDDVRPALQALARGGRMVVGLTNGTADLARIGLAEQFHASFSAADFGVSKPHPGIFAGVCRRLGVAPEDVVHVGDDPLNDVVGPRRIGMHAVWLNRAGAAWPSVHPPPAHTVPDLGGLVRLLFE